MKIRIGIIISLLFIGVIGFVIWYSLPKKIDQTFNGYLFGTGEKDEINEEVTITVKGEMYKKLFGQDRFKGTIDIQGDIPENLVLNEEDVVISFINNSGILSTFNFKRHYGQLFINSNFNKLAIIVFDEVERTKDGASYSWDPENGLGIAAPATNRIEALDLSNEIINILKKPLEY